MQTKIYGNIKRKIQNMFYKNSNTKSNVICLMGTDFENHLKNDIKLIIGEKKKAFCYDIDETIIKKFDYLKSKQINLILSDVVIAKAERFIDLDLMGNIHTQEHIIRYMLKKQILKYQYNNLSKTFMFTVCIRRVGKKQTLISINNLFFDCEIEDRIIKKKHIFYNETGATMLTYQIIWK